MQYHVVECIRLSDMHQIQSIVGSWQHGALDEYGARLEACIYIYECTHVYIYIHICI